MNFATKKVLILSTASLLFTGALAGGSWWWEEAKGKKLAMEVQSIRDQAQMEREFKALQTQWEEVSDLQEYLSGLVIEGDRETIELLSLVDNIARSNGVTVTTGNLGVEVTEEEEKFDDLVVSLALRGGQASVLKVVELLEVLPYAASVERLAFVRSGSSATANLTLRVSIKE